MKHNLLFVLRNWTFETKCMNLGKSGWLTGWVSYVSTYGCATQDIKVIYGSFWEGHSLNAHVEIISFWLSYLSRIILWQPAVKTESIWDESWESIWSGWTVDTLDKLSFLGTFIWLWLLLFLRDIWYFGSSWGGSSGLLLGRLRNLEVGVSL